VLRLRTRLGHLEREQRKGDRCPACRAQPAQLLITTRSTLVGDNSGSARLASCESENEMLADVEPCPMCGWQLKATRIVEVVVHNREDLARLAELGPVMRG
jgi:hypothetical protein